LDPKLSGLSVDGPDFCRGAKEAMGEGRCGQSRCHGDRMGKLCTLGDLRSTEY